MSIKTAPLLAGQFVRLADTDGPCMTLAAVEPFSGLAWVTCRDGMEVRSAMVPVSDLRPFN